MATTWSLVNSGNKCVWVKQSTLLYVRSFGAIEFFQVLLDLPIIKKYFEKIRNKNLVVLLTVWIFFSFFTYTTNIITWHFTKSVENLGKHKLNVCEIKTPGISKSSTIWSVIKTLLCLKTRNQQRQFKQLLAVCLFLLGYFSQIWALSLQIDTFFVFIFSLWW